MDSLLSNISAAASPESLYELYGDDLKYFYKRVVDHQLEEAERLPLFSWAVPAPLRIAVVGEYNHGKSSVINFLLGRNNLLPVSPKRETKITTYIFPLYFSNFSGFGVNQEHAVLVNKKEKGFRVIQLADIKSTVNDPNLIPEDYDLYVYLDNPILFRNIVFIDTPGFVVERGNEWYPVELAKMSDLILMVSDLNKPFTRYHDKFINLLGHHTRKLILAVNKVDLANNPQDVREALTHLITHQKEYTVKFPRFLVSVLDARSNPEEWAEQTAQTEETEDSPEKQSDSSVLGKSEVVYGKEGKSGIEKKEETDFSLKPGEWENKRLWNYLYRQIAQYRTLHRTENWTLNITEMLGSGKATCEEETHKILQEIQESIRASDNEFQSFEEIHNNILNQQSITDELIEEKSQEFEEEVDKVIYEYSSTTNVSIVDRLAKCSKKKEIERIQKTLQREIRYQLEEALARINSIITKQTAGLNLYWFRLLSEIPDGRLIDDTLSSSRSVELRTILYDYLFEEQYFWRKASWDELIKLLRRKGYSRASIRKDNIAWFLRKMRSLFFDCNSEEYLLRHILRGVESPKISQEERNRILQVYWADIKASGFLIFGSSLNKYRLRVQQFIQKYQLKKFNTLKEMVFSKVHNYHHAVHQILKEMEPRLRTSIAEEILALRKWNLQKTTAAQADQLHRLLKDVPLPFQSKLSDDRKNIVSSE